MCSTTRVAIIGYDYASLGGIARASFNLAQGMVAAGDDVEVVVLRAAESWHATAAQRGIRLRTEPRASNSRRISNPQKMIDVGLVLARRLRRLLNQTEPFDAYIVSDDAALSAATVISGQRSILWNHGELGLLLLAGSRSARPLERLGGVWLSRILRAHRAWASRFGMVVSSSRLAREVSQFTIERLTEGIVYPPVDVDTFTPSSAPTDDYALAVGRTSGESSVGPLQEVAHKVPLRTVGGLVVQNGRSYGLIPSDRDLASVYANARMTLHPVLGEYFGYPVAESLACGTPVVAYNVGGPSELIRHGKNGWLAENTRDFVEISATVCAGGYGESIRLAARASASMFSIESVAREFRSRVARFLQ